MAMTTEERKQRDRERMSLARKAKRLAKPFIAIDGEGITDEWGIHTYVLLACSDGDSIYNPSGLDFAAVARFLVGIRERHPDAILVGFGLNYDINCWLRSLGLPFIVEHIFDRNAEEDNGYFFSKELHHYVWLDWKPSKTFTLKVGKGRGLVIYDTFGFFQEPFARALAHYGIGSWDEIARIEQMKDERANFHNWDIEQVREYCIHQCDYLALAMERMRDLCEGLGYSLSRWDGVGALAGEILKQNSIKAHIWQGKAVPDEVLAAFYGGRFEAFQLGEIPQCYTHDLHSAYASAMVGLPCLRNARLDPIGNHPWVGETALLHVRWDIPEDAIIGPFPYRTADDRILYPVDGEGWYWSVEVAVALRRYPYSITVLGGYRLVYNDDACTCGGLPFRFVEGIYAQRLALKATGDMRERPLKLALAAIFGKLAQGVGKPAYQCFVWAGLITATIRARMMQAVFANGREGEREIVLVATDGIYSRVPLDVEGGAGLGQWEVGMVTDLFVAGSGLLRMRCDQHTDPHCEHCGDTGYVTKRRGFGRNEPIPWARLIDAYRKNNVTAEVHVPLRRFIGAQLARYLTDKSKWCSWVQGVSEDAKLEVAMGTTGKTAVDFSRVAVAAPGRIPNGSPDGHRLTTLPDGAPSDAPSKPHKVKSLKKELHTEEDLAQVVDVELTMD